MSIISQVVFPAGVSSGSIALNVRADNVSELNEITTVSLTNIMESGFSASEDQSRGARLFPGRTEAFMTIQANDDPHGVIAWFPVTVLVDEQEGTDYELQLMLIRLFGDIGVVVISYATAMAQSLPSSEQARSLTDFIPTSGDVVMSDGQTSMSVAVTILQVNKYLYENTDLLFLHNIILYLFQDNVPEVNESFIVNITGVRRTNETDGQGSITDSPRISDARRIVKVVIRENDNNRGLLNFDSASLTVAEMNGVLLDLEVVRSRGSSGSISVNYIVNEGTATSADIDVAPTGTLTFEAGQRSAILTIPIVDDQIPEIDEEFEVMLVDVMGGGEIGQPSSVSINILNNDDVNGVFKFSDSSLLVNMNIMLDVLCELYISCRS